MDRKIEFIKPEYEVTIGSAYFCLIKERTNTDISYEDTVLEVPTIKTLGLTRTVSELEVYASGILFDYLNRTAGANIALNAVTLPAYLLDRIEGAAKDAGFTFNRTNDIEREFAFGYWGENSDGSFMFYWHPVCKLTPTEENHQTRTAEIPDPERNYAVRVIPYNNLWRTRYNTNADKEAGYKPLEKAQFFLMPIYREDQIPEREKADADTDTPPTDPPQDPPTDPDDD